MQKINITNAERFDSIPDNATVIDVTFDIVEVDEKGEETIVESLRESFSLKSTADDIRNHLQKRLKNYEAEKATEEIQKEIDETFEVADQTIEALVGVEILSTEEITKE